MTPEEILIKAAELIAERGHCKGELYDNDGRLCMMGAMEMATFGKTFGTTGNDYALETAIEKVLDEVDQSIPHFNDHPATTAEDAILTLKRAAHHD